MSALEAQLEAELQRLREAELYRSRRVIDGSHGATITVDGRRCINFCSNDYLGLAADPRVAEAARKALAAGGTGSGAAALISGYNREHAQLEEELAEFLDRPRTLLFSSGWAANLGVLRALAGRNDTIVADELNHASLIDGARLAGANYVRVPHRDTAAYETALQGVAAGRKLIVTDTVFSMDGDIADLPALTQLAQTHEAVLMVDDAHGFGVLGAKGRGAVEAAVTPHVSHLTPPDVYVATLGKSLGCAGAFVAGSEALIEYLIQRGRTWVFSTAPPPAIAAAARRALRIVRDEPERRTQLEANIAQFRAGLAERGLARAFAAGSDSATAIQPLILGDEARTLAVSRALFERGIWVAGIRPPTVPRGTSRLRVTLSAAHSAEQVDRLLDALAEVLGMSMPRKVAAA